MKGQNGSGSNRIDYPFLPQFDGLKKGDSKTSCAFLKQCKMSERNPRTYMEKLICNWE